ncbi:MAG: hypothetical protein H7Z43_06290 [Clostridia bacterium]|nr:hypothetical protein [Deltaproteobacteria bacterium]
MTAILRNNAVVPDLRQVELHGGGSSRHHVVLRQQPTKQKFRFPADPAAELMPSAEFLGTEPDFAAIIEDFRDSPLDPSRRRILGRLMGMFAMDYQGARNEERRFLRRLLMGRNAREGYAANRALHLCQIPHVVRRTLAIGVAESRFVKGSIGGFLGAVQARNAAVTFMLLGPQSRERIWNVLTKAGTHDTLGPLAGADRLVERTLILKALTARRHRLGPWSVDGRAAIDEVTAFADEIRCCTREHLAFATTLERPERDHISPMPEEPVTSAVLIARANIDPVLAWQMHGRKRVVAETKATGAPQAEDALPDLDRSALLERTRLHQALAEARIAGQALMTAAAREALSGYVTGRDLTAVETPQKDEALRMLAEHGFDVARQESVEAIRDDARGIYRYDAARAFSLLVSRYTGATYVRRVFSDQITAGADPLRQIARALEQGFVVPTILAELKRVTVLPLLILRTNAENALVMQTAGSSEVVTLAPPKLLAPVLPDVFGKRTRVDAYLAPAALDLLAPPFGIAFPEIGVEDRL